MNLISAVGRVKLPVELVKRQSGVTLILAPLVLHFLPRYAPDGTQDVLFEVVPQAPAPPALLYKKTKAQEPCSRPDLSNHQ